MLLDRLAWSATRALFAIAALVLATVLVPAVTRADPAVSLTPTAAGPYDTYVFNGTGFAVGSVLNVTYTDPSGGQHTLTDSYGADTVVKVGNDGGCELRLLPGNAFTATTSGVYHVTFCLPDGGDCWSADLTITRDVPGMGGMGGGGMGGGY